MRAKKLLSLLLSAVMILSVVNVTFASDTVNYIDENGSEAECTKYIRMDSVSENCTLTGGWYLVSGNITIGEGLFISSGEVNLILEDKGTLEVGKGITIEGANLNVYAQSGGENIGKLKSGSREIIPEDNYADIFGIIGDGDFTVNGGNIEISAKINKNYAYNIIYGIYARNVTVNGGSLTVNIADIQSSEEDAESEIEYGQTFGIMAESITVNGGSLKTTAGRNKTEHGVSYGLCGNYITVSGGKVEAGCSEAEFSGGFYSSSSMKVTGGKIKELCINLYTNGIELSGGEYEKIRVENGKSFASAVKTGYGYVDNSGNAVDIDRSTLENVKVVKGDFPYSQQNGGAKITTASESYYVNNADDLMKALTDKNTVEIKLFEDFNYGGEIAEDNILIESPRLLMDLNGYDFYIYTEAVLNLNSEFVLADSSKNKNGRFTAYNVNCDEEMIYDEDLIGYIQPKITISGGELYTAYASFIGADVTVSGGKLTIYNYSSGCIFEYGTLRLTDGVIDGLIMMNSGSVLDIRGGKIKGDRDGNNNGLICIDCTGSISGGETDFMEFTGDAHSLISPAEASVK